MPWDSDPNAVDVKDRTKWWWLAFLVIFVSMLGAIWVYGRVKPHQSIVRVKHILISFNKGDPADEARAAKLVREIRDQLVKGEDFAKLAEKYSNDPVSASRGGDLGYLPRGSFVDAFEAYAWSAPIGQLSDIVQTPYGYHLIVVVDRVISDIDRAKQREEEEWKQHLQGGGTAPAAPPTTPPAPVPPETPPLPTAPAPAAQAPSPAPAAPAK